MTDKTHTATICKYCGKDMLIHTWCLYAAPYRITWDGGYPGAWTDTRPPWYCHDWGARPAGWHHPGCVLDRCQECGGQAICCGATLTETGWHHLAKGAHA
jgi:hypothetical protein